MIWILIALCILAIVVNAIISYGSEREERDEAALYRDLTEAKRKPMRGQERERDE